MVVVIKFLIRGFIVIIITVVIVSCPRDCNVSFENLKMVPASNFQTACSPCKTNCSMPSSTTSRKVVVLQTIATLVVVVLVVVIH